MERMIKILHIEDDDSDALLIQKTIQSEIENVNIKWVSQQKDFESALKNEKYDLIMSDFSLPNFSGIKAFEVAQNLAPDTPYIYVSGHIGEDRAIEAFKRGATDYVLKDKLKKLVPAIKRALLEADEKAKRKEFEEAFKGSEQKLKTIIDNIPIVLFMVNLEGVTTFARGKGFEISGIKSEGLIGQNIAEVYRDVPFELLNGKVINGKEAFLNVLKGETLEGVILYNGRYNDTKMMPYFSDDNKIIGIIGISHDITELINIQNKLKESEELYRTIFESAPIGIARISPDGRYLSANIVLQNILGYTEDELTTMHLEDITYHEDKTKTLVQFTKAISTKSNIVNLEKRYINKYGVIIWVNITSTAIKDKNGEVQFLITMIENINERKIAQLALTESESRYKELTALLPQTIFEINNDLIIIYINKAGLELFMYSEKDLENKLKFEQLIDVSDRELILNHLSQLTIKENIEEIEFTALRKDGTTVPCVIYINKIIKDNIPVGIRGILIDNTERNKILNDLVIAKDRAEEMNRLKSNFLANMSHELRTPLIGILGFSDILKSEIEDDEHRKMVNTIFESGNRLHETLNLILDLSRIEANRIQIKNEVFDAIFIVKDILQLFEGVAETKSLYLKLETPMKKFEVELDERMFRSIIKNLVSNAIKYTTKGGITVNVNKQERKGQHWIIINIIDTGLGIEKENQEIIFEDFRQVSEGFARNFEGVGLGLTITKNFTEKLGGDIKLESTPGKGSTFTVSIPYQTTKNHNHNFPEILLVDDDEVAFRLTKMILSKNYRVEHSTNGNDALKKVEKKKYSAILMDINLKSEMDGMETTKLIRKIPGYKEIPIIALTAYAMVGDEDKFLEAGCSHYLSKPFKNKDLLKILKDAIDR